MTRKPWPSREEWATSYNQPYTDDINNVADSATGPLGDYASPDDIAAAIGELTAWWKVLGRDLRVANAASKAVFLLGPKWRPGWSEAYDRLSDADRDLVITATVNQDRRKRVREMIRDFTNGLMPGDWTASNARPFDAPTVDLILGRQETARQAAVVAYVAQVIAKVPDDAAWQRELDRRADVDAWFSRSHVTEGRGNVPTS